MQLAAQRIRGVRVGNEEVKLLIEMIRKNPWKTQYKQKNKTKDNKKIQNIVEHKVNVADSVHKYANTKFEDIRKERISLPLQQQSLNAKK